MAKGKDLTIRELTLGGLFAALIAAGAFIKITIPVEPVPMHVPLQWFFVLLAGLLLDKRLAGTSVGAYLLLGLMGVPVFASGGGLSYLIRPTFGYLMGFGAAGFTMAWLCERTAAFGFVRLFAVSLAGLLIYYGVGVAYYFFVCRFLISREVTWQILLFNCFLLTAPADLALCAAAASVAAKLQGSFRRILCQL